MDGFTPAFFLNLVIAIMSGGIAYGVLKTDLKNAISNIANEQRLRETHEKEDDQTHHDIRDEMSGVSNRVSIIEGQLKGSR